MYETITVYFFILHVMISFEYVLSPDQLYGSLENGTWNGMVGMLVRDVNYSTGAIIVGQLF